MKHQHNINKAICKTTCAHIRDTISTDNGSTYALSHIYLSQIISKTQKYMKKKIIIVIK